MIETVGDPGERVTMTHSEKVIGPMIEVANLIEMRVIEKVIVRRTAS
jgi:hypothetical protein